MKHYKVVVNWTSLVAFEREVSNMLRSGWACAGGVAFLTSDGDHGWAQALVMTIEEYG